MKTKIIVVLITTLLLATFFSVAQPPLQFKKQNIQNQSMQTLFDDDVPLWEIGDYWTYRINDYIINIEEGNRSIIAIIQISDLTLEVVDDSGDYYNLSVDATVSGNCDIYADMGDGPINVTVELPPSELTGSMLIQKTNLGFKHIDLFIEGRLMVYVWEQPYFDLPFELKDIPIPGDVSLEVEFEEPLAFLDFPLMENKTWNLSENIFTISGQVRSFWLYVIDIINRILEIVGYDLLPPEVDILLPILDLEDAMKVIGINNTFKILSVPYAFFCNSTEQITVDAGTFSAYNISVIGGLGRYYYAPDAGFIVKMQGNFEEITPNLKNIDLELIDTNYS